MQSVYTSTQLGMAPDGSKSTEPILPNEHLGVTIPSCIRVSMWSPAEYHPGTMNMPSVAAREAPMREGTPPYTLITDTLYPTGRYGIALARVERPYPHSR
jgi:hypothetical protein